MRPHTTAVRAASRALCHALAAALMTASAATAWAGAAEVPDEINARIARARSQITTQAGTRGRGVDRDGAAVVGGAASGSGTASIFNDGCTIAIGNVVGDDNRIGTSARKETTVIITGDVIQAGNECR